MIRVLLVDDHPLVRAGIRSLLESASDIVVVAEADNGHNVLPLVKKYFPQVLLLDMELPGMNGLEIARHIQQENLPVQILALSAYDDEQYVRGLHTLSIYGYITKEETPEVIIDAVRGVASGERDRISRKVLGQLSSFSNKRGEYERMGLTRREIEVLKITATGKTNQEIGLELGISEKTVEKHLETIFNKLGVVSRVEASVKLVRAGLL